MECLQYTKIGKASLNFVKESFKPCYKWNAFNTPGPGGCEEATTIVLNLVINGMPSIHKGGTKWILNSV